MPLVSLEDISVSFATDNIFDALELRLYPSQKAGLVGPNGCGKTTLLKIISGFIESTTGSVKIRKNIKTGYLPQEPTFEQDKTVLQELHSGVQNILQLQYKLQELSEKLSSVTGSELKTTMKQYDNLTNEFHLAGGYEYETKLKEISAGLGLDEKYYSLKTKQLSGGQLSRLGLAKVLLAEPDILLLDEPTNHLDWDAILWLEKYLKNFKGSCLLVSHDRFLLDRVVSKIILIENRKTVIFAGNYTDFREQKQKRDLEQNRQYQSRVEFIKKTTDFIDRNRNQKGMTKVARGRATRLEKTLKDNPDFLEKPGSEKELSFGFAPVIDKGQRLDAVLTCNKLAKRYDSLVLFEDLNFELLRGQRLGVIGPNGSGKTTLLKLALEKIKPDEGNIAFKKNLSMGYLDQAADELNRENTVLEEARTVLPEMLPGAIRNKLGAFMFSGDDVFKKVADLSGGEKNRLAICKLVLAEPEILVLDEPTNHLDITSIEALENALSNFAGTVLIVSHDRYFLERTVDKLLVIGVDEFGNGKMGGFEFIEGSVDTYTELTENRIAENEQKLKKSKLAKQPPKPPKRETPAELKKFNAWTIEKIEDQIAETDKIIAQLQENFGDEKIYKNPKLLAKLQREFEEKKQYHDLLYAAYEWRCG